MRSASAIHVLERDYLLNLDSADWPSPFAAALESRINAGIHDEGLKGGRATKPGEWFAKAWTHESLPEGPGGSMSRWIHKDDGTAPRSELRESLVRFPSVPLFGFQRKRDYQFRMRPVHQHTFRLLTARRSEESKTERVFLLFNGLNEIEHFGFYYELAALLIDDRPDVACIIYPYPGHLTRYPMIGNYAEKPLQRFINDPGDLFRQYLRFMVEIQWLLSSIVPTSYYPVAPGIALLAESSRTMNGRHDPICLSAEIAASWLKIHESSSQILGESQQDAGLKAKRDGAGEVSATEILQSINTVRQLIHWEACEKSLAEHDAKAPLPPPRIHVIGYSLGAYLAQSVFFSWPFVVGSCTTVCAGAALRDLRPVKLAHEEEWRSVTHGLKYEIESGMLEGRYRVTDTEVPSVCGIAVQYFNAYFQIFNDVFLQDPHGSYRARVSEFTPRLLFVVGGNDPIVSTASVLAASPPEGINMIEIANLSHFVAIEGGEWPRFWLPTVAYVISSLAEHCEALQASAVLENLWNDETTGPVRGSWPEGGIGATRQRASGRRDAEPLDSERMRTAIGELVEPLKKGAFLLIFRNQVPFTLMGERLLHRRGGVPHYEDTQIRRFWQQLQDRRTMMLHQSDRIVLVLPGRLNDWLSRQPSVLSPKPSNLAREFPNYTMAQIFTDFLAAWEPKGALYRFNPEQAVTGNGLDLEKLVREHTATPPLQGSVIVRGKGNG